MISTKPYFFRAIYQWAADNGFTPQIVVDAAVPGVTVPRQYVKDGQIVLNISPGAVSNFTMDNERLSCAARFSGRSLKVDIPLDAVLAIYARETGHGIYFKPDSGAGAGAGGGDESAAATSAPPPAVRPAKPQPQRPHLQLVKSKPPSAESKPSLAESKPSPAESKPPPETSTPPSPAAPRRRTTKGK